MSQRVVWIDLIRVVAICIIICMHVCVWQTNATVIYIVSTIAIVELYFMASGALALPVRENPAVFLRRRLGRVVPPLLTWNVIYYVYFRMSGVETFDVWQTLLRLPFSGTFTESWFLYVLIGIYLAMPVISPWVERASRNALRWVLAAWLVSGLIPFLDLIVEMPVIGKNPLAPFCLMLGYPLMGYYLVHYPSRGAARIIFFVVTAAFFMVEIAVHPLFSWRVDVGDGIRNDLSISQTAVATGMFMVFMFVTDIPGWLATVVRWLTPLVFGIYLSHHLIYNIIVSPLSLRVALAVPLTLGLAILFSALVYCLPFKVRRWLM